MGPERGRRPGGFDPRRPDPDRRTSEAGGAPTDAAWEAAQVSANAKTKTKPNPQAEASTRTGTSAGIDAGNHIIIHIGEVRSADTDQMMGDCPTTKPKEAG